MRTRQQILNQMVLDFLKEIETLMEEDEGIVFQIQHIEMHEELMDMLKEEGYE